MQRTLDNLLIPEVSSPQHVVSKRNRLSEAGNDATFAMIRIQIEPDLDMFL